MDSIKDALREMKNNKTLVESDLENVEEQRQKQLLLASACLSPLSGKNAIMTGCSAPYLPNTKCTFECKKGYVPLIGDADITCGSGKLWKGDPLHCAACRRPPPPLYADILECSAPYLVGEKCIYKCKNGYELLSGDTVRKCTSDRTWSGKPISCKSVNELRRELLLSACLAPPRGKNANMNGCSAPYLPNTKCSFECKNGYVPYKGDESITCVSNKLWSGDPLSCDACGKPSSLPNVVISQCFPPYLVGTKCTYYCMRGFGSESGDTYTSCTSDRTWNGNPPNCKRACRAPRFSADRVDIKGCSAPYLVGEKCTFKCKRGYARPSGDTERTCTHDAAWSGDPFTCMKECESAPTIPNTIKKACSNKECRYKCKDECESAPTIPNTIKKNCSKTECKYECKDGYNRGSGDTLLHCNSRGKWLGKKLNCKPRAKTGI
ncbi:hypothetical protein Bbelb_100660 [Branchiostoma belcheri]|nr:hypothetical protein Bbelb_100660 [Branchiostoma belcheri]